MLELYETVDERVAYRNGEVIGKAFREASIYCPHCSYPENAGDFHFWLVAHIEDKINLHRARRGREMHFDHCLDRDGRWRGWVRHKCSTCNYHSSSVYRCEREAGKSRVELKEIWPCEDCISQYNPTARINHVLRNRPELKGFLDVRFD